MTVTGRAKVVGLAALGLQLGYAAWCFGQGEPTLVCRFEDKRINEASGIAAAGRGGGYFFVHNDSGDRPQFFAVSQDGKTLATFRVPGAEAIDWEDMAAGRSEDGTRWLYLGDIGDNNRRRATVQVYKVREPQVDPSRAGVTADTEPAVRYEVKYPDGAQDAETLMVTPGGRLFIVGKSATGSNVYAAPVPLKAGETNTLAKIGAIQFAALPSTPKGVRDHVLKLLATGGAIAPSGDHVTVRTYTDAYEWTVPKGDIGAAFKSRPRHFPLPEMKQGEAITYSTDGKALLTCSEGENAPVYRLTVR
jgi:hypothetical protein